MPSTTFLLCRHGQSEWNAQQRIQGQSPAAGGLTAQGRAEAELLGRRLHTLGAEVLISSDLLRARQTAEIAGQSLGLTPQLDPRWREIDLGKWQGLTIAEVEVGWPNAPQMRELDLPRGEIGETGVQLQARTVAALADLHQTYPGRVIAVVCHGGNVRTALMLTPPIPAGHDIPDPRRMPIPNTSVTILCRDETGLHAELIADVSHLVAPDLSALHPADVKGASA